MQIQKMWHEDKYVLLTKPWLENENIQSVYLLNS